MIAIYKKELGSYFNGITGSLFAAGFFLIFGVSFLQECILGGSSDITEVFTAVSTLSMLLIPFLTVQMFTMEKKNNTWSMLCAAPVDTWGIVMGKYLAAVTLAAAAVTVTWIYALVLSMYTTLFVGEFIVNQIGIFLLMQAFISMGELISAVSKRRLTASAITIALQFLLFIISLASSRMGASAFSGIVKLVSPYNSYTYFSLGIFSVSGAFSLLSFSGICLILTVRCVEYGRFKGV